MSSAEYRTVQVRLTAAEHDLLKRHARPNITGWLRAAVRALPGGEALPALDAPPPDVGEAPPWTPRPVIVGERPGNPTMQAAAFVAAVSAVPLNQLTWKRWRPIHELYEGLRQVLARGQGLRLVCKEATEWDARGRRPHTNQGLFEALFKFWDFKRQAKSWWERSYKVSNAKRRKAKAKDPEVFLSKHRERQKKYRARCKDSAAVKEREQRREALFEEFMTDHVTPHDSVLERGVQREEAGGVGPLDGGVARGPVVPAQRSRPAEVSAACFEVARQQLVDRMHPLAESHAVEFASAGVSPGGLLGADPDPKSPLHPARTALPEEQIVRALTPQIVRVVLAALEPTDSSKRAVDEEILQ